MGLQIREPWYEVEKSYRHLWEWVWGQGSASLRRPWSPLEGSRQTAQRRWHSTWTQRKRRVLQVEGTTGTEAEQPETVRRVRDLWVISCVGMWSSRELSVEAITEHWKARWRHSPLRTSFKPEVPRDSFMEENFSTDQWQGWRDDSSASHLV